MKDVRDRDLRDAPKGTWDYLKHNRETWEVCCWVWKEFISFKAKKWAKVALAALCANIVLQLLFPVSVQYVFNGLLARSLETICLGFGSYLICMVCGRFADYWSDHASTAVMIHVRAAKDQRITELLFEKSMGQHFQEGSNLSDANIERGRNCAGTMIEMLLFHGVDITIRLMLSFVLVFCISPVVGFIMALVVAFHLIWSFCLNKEVMKHYTPIERDWRRLNRWRIERWKKIERVKANGNESAELEAMDAFGNRVIDFDLAFWRWYRKMTFVRGTVAQIALVVSMAYGAKLVWNGQWMLGDLYPLFTWAGTIAFNIWQISALERRLNWIVPSISATKEALTMEPDIVWPKDAPAVCSEEPISVAFENVSYAYPNPGNGLGVLKNVSFRIAPGEKVALIGSSGAGKTTIIRLLERFADPSQGRIRVNGHDLREINLSSWVRAVGYVPQGEQVFDGTIRENLLYGLPAQTREQISEEEIWGLVDSLQINFGERLTDGLETVVGHNGVKLSGGQAQRLMLGAAAMRRPKFMIIDEGTSHLDSVTEKLVHDGLAKVLSTGVGALIVAHRLSTVRDLCGRFIVLKDASTVNNGDSQVEAVASSFEELYRISPTFRQLADEQKIRMAN